MDSRLTTCVVAGALLAAACGLQGEDQAHELDADSVPFDLLEDEAPAGSPALPEDNAFNVYILQDDTLVAVTRAVEKEPTVNRALRVLFQGITRIEADEGRRSAIPPGSAVRRVTVRGKVAIVDLNAQFREDVGDDAELALAQIVWTATSLQGVTRVRILVDGEPLTPLPRGDSTLVRGKVSRNDYPGPGP